MCELCMCLARSRVGGVGVIGLGLAFSNPVGTGRVWHVCSGVGGVISVCVVSLDYLSRWQVQVSVQCALCLTDTCTS